MRVLFLSSSELPDQCANATRIVNLAKLMKTCGHECTLAGIRYTDQTPLYGEYEGLEYVHMDACRYSSVGKLKRRKYIKNLVLQMVQEQWDVSPYGLIVISDFAFQNMSFLLQFAKKHDICVASNAVEWYEKDNISFQGIAGKWKYCMNYYKMVIEQPKLRNVIAISSYLAEYYSGRGCHVVRIPTIVDKNKYGFVSGNNHKKTVVTYAGSPGKKDYICNAIHALGMLEKDEQAKIELHLYGVMTRDLLAMGMAQEELQSLQGILFAHGRIPHKDVQEKISSADFTVLLRPNLRYANAGFPTKVGESMMCGTPVIANHTGDLKRYIRNDETGIVVEDESSEACAKGFRLAIGMTHKEKLAMRLSSRQEAEKSFYYSSYRDDMTEFIEELKRL